MRFIRQLRDLIKGPFPFKSFYFRAGLTLLLLCLGTGAGLFGWSVFTYLSEKGSMAVVIQSYRARLVDGDERRRPPIRIYSRNKELLSEYYPERDSVLSLKRCRGFTRLAQAAVAAEDREFYDHSGWSYRGILRAAWRNLIHLSIREGASTITQQLARNLFLRDRSGFSRKFLELLIARQIESILNKDEILCLYLSRVYMGEGRRGAEEAARFYFRKPPEKLDAAEAAMIAGMFPAPVRYSPLNNIGASLKKQTLVLEAMHAAGSVANPRHEQELFKTRYGIENREQGITAGSIGLYGADRDFGYNLAPDVSSFVRSFLASHLDAEIIAQGGLTVYTTIDSRRQSAAIAAMRARIENLRRNLGKNSAFGVEETRRLQAGLNGVLVALEPATGDILALVGGFRASEEGWQNRAWIMRRQPGSAIKGFLYALALEDSVLEPNAEVLDEPVNLGGYNPPNWYAGYEGPMTLRRAIARSTNTVAVKTLHDLGTGRFVRALGDCLDLGYLEARDRFPANLTLALGTGEVSPIELARLYAPLLNEGITIRPILIREIRDPQGRTFWVDENSTGDRLLSAEAAAGAVDLLTGVVEEGGTVDWIAARRAQDPGYLTFPLAAKTGTVASNPAERARFKVKSGVRDVWFVALVPQEVSVTWIGQDEGMPFEGSGAGTAAALWVDYARAGLNGHVSGSFRDPAPDHSREHDPKNVDQKPDVKQEGQWREEQLQKNQPGILPPFEKDDFEIKDDPVG